MVPSQYERFSTGLNIKLLRYKSNQSLDQSNNQLINMNPNSSNYMQHFRQGCIIQNNVAGMIILATDLLNVTLESLQIKFINLLYC
jgi:hypothetical protein